MQSVERQDNMYAEEASVISTLEEVKEMVSEYKIADKIVEAAKRAMERKQ